MNLANYFGVNVEERYRQWFRSEYAESVKGRDEGKGVTLVVLDPARKIDQLDGWGSASLYDILIAHTGDPTVAEAADGTRSNVNGKLNFFLRTGVRWTDEDPPIHLLEEGDFPHEGAGCHRGLVGGLSGLPDGKLDWEDFKRCIDKLIELISVVAAAAIERANAMRQQGDAPVGIKYLNGIDVSDLFPARWDEALSEEPTVA